MYVRKALENFSCLLYVWIDVVPHVKMGVC